MLYSELYFGDSEPGAVAETFGRLPVWEDDMLLRPATGLRVAIGAYDLADNRLCDLDDAQMLMNLALRPSEVITRDYTVSNAWAKRIFSGGGYIGAKWWSYYDSSWASIGIWDISSVKTTSIRPLTVADSAIQVAAKTIARQILK